MFFTKSDLTALQNLNEKRSGLERIMSLAAVCKVKRCERQGQILYLETIFRQKDLAEILEVPVGQIRDWKKEKGGVEDDKVQILLDILEKMLRDIYPEPLKKRPPVTGGLLEVIVKFNEFKELIKHKSKID